MLLLVTGLVGPSALDNYIDKYIKDLYVPEPSNDKAFKDWRFNDRAGFPKLYQIFWAFNITNREEMLYHGAPPEVEEVGPFVYQRHEHKLGVWTTDKQAGFKKRVFFEPVYKPVRFSNADGSETEYRGLNADETPIMQVNPIIFAAAHQAAYNPYHSSLEALGDLLCNLLHYDELSCLDVLLKAIDTLEPPHKWVGVPYVLEKDGGLVQTRSFASWLAVDPSKAKESYLLGFVNKYVRGIPNADNRFGFMYNVTQMSDDVALRVLRETVVSFDRDDLRYANTFLKWNGLEVLHSNAESDVEPYSVNVLDNEYPFKGWGKALNFTASRWMNPEFTHPHLKRSEAPTFWLALGVRAVPSYYVRDVHVKGVHAYEFLVNNSILDGGEQLGRDFFSPIAGLVNESQTKDYAPVYVSYPHYLGYDNLRKYPIKGLPPANEKEDVTFAHVEPRTGLVIDAGMRLQVNVMVPQWNWRAVNSSYNLTGTLLPVLRFEKRAQMTDTIAYDLRILQKSDQIKFLMRVVGLTAGAAFVLLSMALLVRAVRRQRRRLQWSASTSTDG